MECQLEIFMIFKESYARSLGDDSITWMEMGFLGKIRRSTCFEYEFNLRNKNSSEVTGSSNVYWSSRKFSWITILIKNFICLDLKAFNAQKLFYILESSSNSVHRSNFIHCFPNLDTAARFGNSIQLVSIISLNHNQLRSRSKLL